MLIYANSLPAEGDLLGTLGNKDYIEAQIKLIAIK